MSGAATGGRRRADSVAVLCDVHGNLPALDAVLAELAADPPGAVVVGGDVAAGPMPVEVLERLAGLPWPLHWVRGNADRAVVMGYDGTIPEKLLEHPLYRADQWTAGRMSRGQRDFLDGLPTLARLEVAGFGPVLFCHGTPASDEERVTSVTPEARVARTLDGVPERMVVCGHTHRQFDLTAGRRRMINAGSVGRPYEHRPGAYWLRLGPEVALRRTEYDVEAAAETFARLGYPLAHDMLAPVDADAVAARYEANADAPVAPESRTGWTPTREER